MNGLIKLWHLLLAVVLIVGGVVAAYYRGLGAVEQRVSEVRETYVSRAEMKGEFDEIKRILWGMRADLEQSRREQVALSESIRALESRVKASREP